MLPDLNINSDVVLRILGVISIIIGMAGVLGFWKRWYWRSQRNTVYGYPLLGIICFLVSYEDYILENLQIEEWVLISVYLALFGVVVWISYSPPEFLKPKFVKRIEEEPPEVYERMAKHVMEDKPWREKAKSPEALEKWIKAVKRSIR